jgi:Zn-finger nucleic acid-binding protein
MKLGWLCLVCGNMTPRHEKTTLQEIGFCPHCKGEFAAVDLDNEMDQKRVQDIHGSGTGEFLYEVDYYEREEDGHRYHLRTSRIRSSDPRHLAFNLPQPHHGIQRVRRIA